MTERDHMAASTEETARLLDERELGFWIYLMSDAVIFALLFATYGVMAGRTAGGPAGHDLFGLTHTFGETMLLLASSITFGMASLALAAARRPVALVWLAVTFVLGFSFVVMEITEFQGLIAQGAGPDRSGFLSAFFTLVATHGLHVSFGLIWIVVLGGELAVRGATPYVASRIFRLGLFWHFLDIVWIGIFSFVYLRGLL